MVRAHKTTGNRRIVLPLLCMGVCLAMVTQRVDYLKYSLEAKPGDLTVDRMPSIDPNAKSYQEEFLFTVTNPMRSDFSGTAPTSKTFDVEVFFVQGDKETSVWRWSTGHIFSNIVTKVSVPAVHTWRPEGNVIWSFKAGEVKDGNYRAVATFVPTGNKQAVAKFTITSAH